MSNAEEEDIRNKSSYPPSGKNKGILAQLINVQTGSVDAADFSRAVKHEETVICPDHLIFGLTYSVKTNLALVNLSQLETCHSKYFLHRKRRGSAGIHAGGFKDHLHIMPFNQ